MTTISKFLGMDPPVTGVLLTIGLLLVGATFFRGVRLVRTGGRRRRKAWRSLATWWVLYLLLLFLLLIGRPAVGFGMLVVSLLALRETLRLVLASSWFSALGLLVAALYLWGWLDWVLVFTIVLPVTVLLLIAALASRGLRVALLHDRPLWLAVAVFESVLGPSFVLGTASLAPSTGPQGPRMGWFLALVILTELNDIAQALWGRAFGRRQIAPKLSPGKTWEGAVGGIFSTSILAVALLPLLTTVGRTHPLGMSLPVPPWIWSLFLGTVLAVAGIGGDLIASLLKRKRGVKDAGDLLPAQGGILDRFDSLAGTAPVYFLLSYYLWIRPW